MRVVMKKTVSNSCFHNQRGKPSIAFSKKQSFTWQTCPRQLGRVRVRVKEEEHVRMADKKREGWSKSLMALCCNSAGARSSDHHTSPFNLTWKIHYNFQQWTKHSKHSRSWEKTALERQWTVTWNLAAVGRKMTAWKWQAKKLTRKGLHVL